METLLVIVVPSLYQELGGLLQLHGLRTGHLQLLAAAQELSRETQG